MAIDEIMGQAAAYVAANIRHIGSRPGPLDLHELINDAANIFSGSYNEYCTIAAELSRRFLFA